MKHRRDSLSSRTVMASRILFGVALVAASLALPFLKYQAGWLVFLAPIPLLFFIEWLESQTFPKRYKVMAVWLVGVVFFGIVVSWLYHIHATDLIQDSLLRNVFIVITFLLVAIWLSIGLGLFAWLIFHFKIMMKNPITLFIIPALWGATEFVRSVAFSIFSFGPGSSIGSHWNFGVLGFAASSTAFAYGGRIVGLFGLSILVMAVSVAMYNLLRRRNIRLSLVVICSCIAVTGLGSFVYGQAEKPHDLHVGLTYLASDEDVAYEPALLSSVESRPRQRVDVLILPEYSHFYEDAMTTLADQKIVLATLGTNPAARIITSQSGTEAEGHSNNLTVMDTKGKTLVKQPKQFLIPAGEFIPYIYQIILEVSGNKGVVSNHGATKSLTPGQQRSQPILIHGARFGALACSGAIAPEFYRNLVRQGAEVLVNTASLSSMGIDKLYFEQSRQMARFQAVANARPFIQSSRGGESYAIDANGNFLFSSHGDKTQFTSGVIQSNSRRTLYSILGEWLLALSTALLGMIVYLTRSGKQGRLKHKREYGKKR